MNVTCDSYLKYLCKSQEISNATTCPRYLFYRHPLSKYYALYFVREEMELHQVFPVSCCKNIAIR